MSLTVLDDVVISNAVLDAGIRGRQLRRNQRVAVASGYESINIVWDRTLREYDLGIVPLRRAAWQEIEALFEVTEGGAYGFLLQDPKDSSVAVTEGVVAGPITDEANTFQLFKRYTERASSRTKDRKITRPRNVTMYVGGVERSATVDEETGRVVLDGASVTTSVGVTWTGTFLVPVHFVTDQIDWTLAIAGPSPDARFLTGPTVTVREILEGLPVV